MRTIAENNRLNIKKLNQNQSLKIKSSKELETWKVTHFYYKSIASGVKRNWEPIALFERTKWFVRFDQIFCSFEEKLRFQFLNLYPFFDERKNKIVVIFKHKLMKSRHFALANELTVTDVMSECFMLKITDINSNLINKFYLLLNNFLYCIKKWSKTDYKVHWHYF
jgi:hypothetical protein